MAASRTFGGAGLQVDGMSDTLSGLRKIGGPQARNEVVKIIREESKGIALKARQVADAHPAAPSSSTWISWRANNKGAGILLRGRHKSGRGWATEFGMHRWQHPTGEDGTGPTRRTVQSAMRRRTFDRYSDGDILDNGSGYVIRPTIRRELPKFERDLADRLVKWMDRKVENG